MNLFRMIVSFALVSLVFAFAAFGQELPFPVPDVDPLEQALKLFREWGTVAPLVSGMGFVVLLVQGMKKFAPGFKYNRVIVTVLSVVYGVLSMVINDALSWGDAIMLALFTGGGAVAIYEAWKGLNKTVQKVIGK